MRGYFTSNNRQTSVDFGPVPVSDGSFIVIDPLVLPTMVIVTQMAYQAPPEKDVDEMEMDDLEIRCVAGDGQFTMFIRAADGSYVSGQFTINYTTGI